MIEFLDEKKRMRTNLKIIITFLIVGPIIFAGVFATLLVIEDNASSADKKAQAVSRPKK